jgi:hypothetical protein
MADDQADARALFEALKTAVHADPEIGLAVYEVFGTPKLRDVVLDGRFDLVAAAAAMRRHMMGGN